MSVGGGSSEYVLEGRVESSGVDAFQSAMAGAGSAVDDFKTKVGLAGTAVAALSGGALAGAVSAAADFESSMVELEKVTDPQTAREMGDAIMDMSSQMPLAQEELAGIAEQAGRLGITGTDNIQNFTQVVGEMATATDLTAEEAADSFARMTTLMNEPVENVRTLGDTVNALSNSMATSSSEITDAATRSAGALTNMGMASEDILSLNAAMNEVSPSARVAGTQLRRMGQEMMNPAKAGALADALGMNVKEFKNLRSNDPTALIQQMAEEMGQGGEAADKLRGTLSTTSRQALAGLSNNLDGMNKALETSSQQFAEGGSLAAEFETAMGTFHSQVQITRNVLNNIAITIGNVLLPHLTTLMERVSGALRRFQDWNEAMGGIPATITLITGLVGGLGAALWGLVGVGPVITGIGTAFAVLTGPIGLAAAAVAAFAGAFATDLGNIRTVTMRVVGVLRDELLGAWTTLQSTVGPIISQLAGAWESGGERMQFVASGLAGTIGEKLVGHIRTLGAVTQQITAQISALWNTHGGAILSMINLISTNLNEALISAMAAVTAALEGDWVQMRSMFQQGKASLLNIWNALWPQVRMAATAGFNAVVTWIRSSAIPMAKRAFQALATQALTALNFTQSQIVPPVRSGLQTAWTWLRTEGVTLAKSAFSFLTTQAMAAFAIGRERVVPPVRTALEQAWTWVRTEGVALAKTAFSYLATQALAAFTIGREQVVPRVRAGLDAAWTWVNTQGVALAKQAFSFLSTQALAALAFTQAQIVPRVKSGLDTAWTWLKTEGVTLAKQAFSFLATQALTALAFTQEQIVPPVRNGLNQAWTWARTKGVTLAKNALSFLTTQALLAWEFTRDTIVPPVRNGLQQAWTWVRTQGVALGKLAFRSLVTLLMAAVDFWNGAIQPKLTSAFGSAATWIRNQGFEKFKAAFRALGSNWFPAILDTLGLIRDALQIAVPKALGWVQKNGPGMAKMAFKAIGTAIRLTIGTMFAIPGLVGQAIVSGIVGIYQWLSSGGSERIKQGFVDILTGVYSYLKNEAWSDLKAAAKFLFDAVMAAAEGLYEGLIGNSLIPDMFDDILEYIRGVDIQAAILEILNDAYLWIKNTAAPQFVGAVDDMMSDVLSAIEDIDVVGAMKDLFDGAGSAASSAFKSAFNAAIPSSIGLPSTEIAGQTIGGGSLNLPQLDTGGYIERGGLAQLHSGEQVLTAAQVDQTEQGGGGDTINITIDARGAEKPRETERRVRRAASALDAKNVSRQ